MIRCVAIDDEPLALEQISRYIRRIPDLELVASGLSVEDALPVIKSGGTDLLFLDIEMPDVSGMDFARGLGDKAPCVIFTTAYPQYAVEGFRVDAVDYLLKPLSFDELNESVAKARRRMAQLKSETPDDDTLCVRASGSVRIIKLDDILYIKGFSEYVQVCMRGEAGKVTTLESMKNLEDMLRRKNFMRVHRSYIVNLGHVTEANRNQLKIGAERIPVGEKYRKQFGAFLQSLQGSGRAG